MKEQDILENAIKFEKGILQEADDKKVINAIKLVINSKWSGSNEEQGKILEIMKAIAFSDEDISDEFMKDLDSATSKMKIEDYK